MWANVIWKVMLYALAYFGGIALAWILMALLTYANAQDDIWFEYNLSAIPVYVEDWRLYHAWEEIDMDSIRRMRCREAISNYHASIVVLQMFLAEGQDLMEVYGDNIRARYKDVEEACNAD